MALIKSYLPVRIRLPNDDDTFCYIKEHRDPDQKSKQTDTIFVANAPVVPGVETKKVLEALFGRYGEIKRVTVIRNPRQESDIARPWSKFSPPSFLPASASYSDGKFAHIVFATSRDAKRAIKDLTTIMKNGIPIDFSAVEIQTLVDDSTQDEHDEEQATSCVKLLANRYRRSIVPREELLEECNQIMDEYERLEEDDRKAREEAAKEADDGFVTVTYTSQVGSKRELEDTESGRGKASKRSRKKKDSLGASKLQDFYRFQTKEKKKKTVQELREQFQKDLERIQKLKEEKRYKPF